MSAPASGITRYRPGAGPALLGAGFRPFFLKAPLWPAVAGPMLLAPRAGR